MTGTLAISCANSAHTHRWTRGLRRVEPATGACGGEDRRRAFPNTPPAGTPERPVTPLSSVAAQILGARGGDPRTSGYGAYAKAAKLLQLESYRVDVQGL